MSMSATFLVTADGQAPTFTYVMIKLNDIPVSLLGLPNRGTAAPASLFWGTLIGGITFFFKIFRIKL